MTGIAVYYKADMTLNKSDVSVFTCLRWSVGFKQIQFHSTEYQTLETDIKCRINIRAKIYHLASCSLCPKFIARPRFLLSTLIYSLPRWARRRTSLRSPNWFPYFHHVSLVPHPQFTHIPRCIDFDLPPPIPLGISFSSQHFCLKSPLCLCCSHDSP